jgi:acyl carrier protein
MTVPDTTDQPAGPAPTGDRAVTADLSFVAALIGEITGLPASSVVPEADLIEDLYIDSVAKIELMVACESQYGVHIDDEVASRLRTVGSVLEYLAASQAKS